MHWVGGVTRAAYGPGPALGARNRHAARLWLSSHSPESESYVKPATPEPVDTTSMVALE
jgi:hypothetical protein